jgi:hypothetical protein
MELTQMNKNCQDKEKAKLTEWDEAIAFTQKKLERAEKQADRLRKAINTYTWNRDRGFPWPTSATRN